jgi:hypothetical protein
MHQGVSGLLLVIGRRKAILAGKRPLIEIPVKDRAFAMRDFDAWSRRLVPRLLIGLDAGRTDDPVKPAWRVVRATTRDPDATAWNRHAAGHRARDLPLAALARIALARLARVRGDGHRHANGDDDHESDTRNVVLLLALDIVPLEAPAGGLARANDRGLEHAGRHVRE